MSNSLRPLLVGLFTLAVSSAALRAVDPDPFDSQPAGATGHFYSDWFGAYTDLGNNQISSDAFGTSTLQSYGAQGTYLSVGNDWMYTASYLFPQFYSTNQGKWVTYRLGSNPPAFYDPATPNLPYLLSGSGVAVGTVSEGGYPIDYVVMSGASVKVQANLGRATRVYFLDPEDNLVVAQITNGGEMTITLDSFGGVAAPTKYNLPGQGFAKGLASIVLSDVTRASAFSVFSFGRATASDPSILNDGATLTGRALLKSITVEGSGELGQIDTSMARLAGSTGIVGIDAPGTKIYSLNIGEIAASDSATPYLLTGIGTPNVSVVGSSLTQPNEKSIVVSDSDDNAGFAQLETTAGYDANGTILPEADFLHSYFHGVSGTDVEVAGQGMDHGVLFGTLTGELADDFAARWNFVAADASASHDVVIGYGGLDGLTAGDWDYLKQSYANHHAIILVAPTEVEVNELKHGLGLTSASTQFDGQGVAGFFIVVKEANGDTKEMVDYTDEDIFSSPSAEQDNDAMQSMLNLSAPDPTDSGVTAARNAGRGMRAMAADKQAVEDLTAIAKEESQVVRFENNAWGALEVNTTAQAIHAAESGNGYAVDVWLMRQKVSFNFDPNRDNIAGRKSGQVGGLVVYTHWRDFTVTTGTVDLNAGGPSLNDLQISDSAPTTQNGKASQSYSMEGSVNGKAAVSKKDGPSAEVSGGAKLATSVSYDSEQVEVDHSRGVNPNRTAVRWRYRIATLGDFASSIRTFFGALPPASTKGFQPQQAWIWRGRSDVLRPNSGVTATENGQQYLRLEIEGAAFYGYEYVVVVPFPAFDRTSERARVQFKYPPLTAGESGKK